MKVVIFTLHLYYCSITEHLAIYNFIRILCKCISALKMYKYELETVCCQATYNRATFDQATYEEATYEGYTIKLETKTWLPTSNEIERIPVATSNYTQL